MLEALGIEPEPAAPVEVSDAAAALLAALEPGPASADELVRATGLPPGAAAAALAELELAGLAAEGDGVYRGVMPIAK